MTDLRQAAEILRGRHVHPDCRLIVVPATQRIYREAMREGLLDVFVEAGAMVLDADLRGMFRRRDGRPRPGRACGDDDEPQLQGADGLRRGRGAPGERVARRGRAVAGELVHPAEVLA
jgi:3-isopropylmalate/(R)-2-methylmalate dehydratase large subunit